MDKDIDGQKRLFEDLYEHFRMKLIHRLVYRNGRIPGPIQEELAHSSFLMAWESFSRQGLPAGGIEGDSLLPYFNRIVKNKFIDACRKEVRTRAEEAAYQRLVAGDQNEPELFERKDEGQYSPRMQMALEKVGEPCREALILKYEHRLSHEAIALKRGVQLESSRQMIWRCRKRFIELYEN
jgi:RNA polymerase sigma factor (sigma-70 family)